MKLLVPISFSKKSEMALDFALAYSQTTNAVIYLFHVIEESTSDYRKLDRLNEEFMERMKHTCMQGIERAHAKGVTHKVEDVHRRIANGKPWQEILRMAGGIGADMIIMGSPSGNAFKKLQAQVPCTIVLVKEKDPEFVLK
jgi:nucleotide-binding universal stress UspA family protein